MAIFDKRICIRTISNIAHNAAHILVTLDRVPKTSKNMKTHSFKMAKKPTMVALLKSRENLSKNPTNSILSDFSTDFRMILRTKDDHK